MLYKNHTMFVCLSLVVKTSDICREYKGFSYNSYKSYISFFYKLFIYFFFFCKLNSDRIVKIKSLTYIVNLFSVHLNLVELLEMYNIFKAFP